jgi:hypothetical protein
MIVSAATLADMQTQLRYAAEQLQHVEAEVSGILAEVPADAQVGLDHSWCARSSRLWSTTLVLRQRRRALFWCRSADDERNHSERGEASSW